VDLIYLVVEAHQNIEVRTLTFGARFACTKLKHRRAAFDFGGQTFRPEDVQTQTRQHEGQKFARRTHAFAAVTGDANYKIVHDMRHKTPKRKARARNSLRAGKCKNHDEARFDESENDRAATHASQKT
jgi:hypothetical protein